MVKAINSGGRDAPSRALVYNGRLRATPKAKSNAFVQDYAATCAKVSNKKTRAKAVRLAKRLKRLDREERETDETEEPFTIGEMKAALNRMKPGKAAGPDGIQPEFIRASRQSCGIQPVAQL